MFNGLTTAISWSTVITSILVMSCLLYVVCLRIAFVRARRNAKVQPISAWRVGAFFLGILLVAVLLMLPINTIARTQLFSLHMGQVVALTTGVCAPLLIAGWPTSLLWPLDAVPVMGKVVRFFFAPVVASLLFNGTFLVWHLPIFYDQAMKSPTLYHVMVGSIFVMSILNWWPLIGAQQSQQALSLPWKMAYAFFDGQPVDIFAFVLVFSGVPLYHLYVFHSNFC